MQIKMLEHECWWGGIVDLAEKMPFTEKTKLNFDVDSEIGHDQHATVFMSNLGRYIYSKKNFNIDFDSGIITIKSDYDVELSEGHKTLRGAHRAVAAKYFQSPQNIPNQLFFSVPQYNTWIELMYNQNQKQILEYAHSIVDNGMPAGILMIDEGWAEDYGVYDFYPGRFSDPKAMIDELHSLGFTVMLWMTPYISPDSHAFRELREKDFLLKDKDKKIAIREWWNGFSCGIDLQNPNAAAWLRDKLQNLIDKYEIDGFKFDGADPSFYKNDDFGGISSIEHTGLYDAFASNYEFNELRAVWNMSGAPLVCRLQDKLHSWNDYGLNCIVPFTIMQGLLGYYYCCPDMIGGGSFGAFLGEGFQLDQELYIRWLQASVLCPMMQFSIAPWRVLSPENYEIVKKFTDFRKKMSPYILSLAKDTLINHDPIARSLEYEFPNSGFESCRDMFMLGDKYLVIPMLEKGAVSRTVRIPDGKWKLPDGEIITGGDNITFDYKLDTLIYLERM